MENSGVVVEADQKDKDPSQELSLVRELGQGHLSRVFLALHRMSKELYAVKVVRKPSLFQRVGAFKLALREKDILSSLDHPFLPSLFTHFESDNYIFLATKYCSGGDMSMLRLRQPNQTFSVSATRFYAAEVVLALEYLHKKGIVYRDLKPKNILVQDSGHIILTDFDLSLRLSSIQQKETEKLLSNSRPRIGECSKDSDGCSSQRSHSLVGTKEYMAPEILWNTGHAFPVDWWSLGIVLYEMVYGRTPFCGANRKETFYNILCKDPFFTGPFSTLQDLIEKLLVKEPSRRLGTARGAEEVKTHHFFHGLRWEELEFVSRPPLIPSNFSSDQCSVSSQQRGLIPNENFSANSCNPQDSIFQHF
ncbi:hypothetical protein SUGI_0602250 [Cryptomeria japonica]|uniref:serine/threonine-protein kinase UCN n=1 Tax=Cryptomeria japonica TaxID=3369 RepID=UPI00241477E5|nr:serine/threonine-protein kinase UCN [Cryptomeria japonica]GLJ30428.1 hypothetical protein SUGI_0602250 [Cryptomeria japonica]